MRSLNDNDRLLIEKYIDDNLTKEEKALFDSKIKDNEFLEELRLQKTIIYSLNETYRKGLKKELKEHLKQTKIPEIRTQKRKQKIFPVFYLAASVLLIIFISLLFLFKSETTTHETVFETAYVPYPVTTTTRNETSQNTLPAFEKYRLGEYEEAAIFLEQLILKNDTTFSISFLQLLLGNCYLNSNDFNQALITFEKVANSKDNFLKQHGQWYYALTLLKANEIDASISKLKAIHSSNSIYTEQAQDLLEDLNN